MIHGGGGSWIQVEITMKHSGMEMLFGKEYVLKRQAYEEKKKRNYLHIHTQICYQLVPRCFYLSYKKKPDEWMLAHSEYLKNGLSDPF